MSSGLGIMRAECHKRGGNRLLAALSRSDAERLAPHLKDAALARSQVLYEPQGDIERAYFPHTALLSLVTVLSSGPTVETAIVGREGFLGVSLLTSHGVSANRAVVQIAGRASSIAANRLDAALGESRSMRELFGRYAHAFLGQVFQSVACNAVHSAEERFARWLLSAADRNGGAALALTHEFVAQTLGVGRPTLTLVARSLQTAGLIEYRRGLILVVDRIRLEEVACECYWTVRQIYEQFLPLAFVGK